MKIDIGSGGYGYSSPAYYVRREAGDAETAEEAATDRQFSLAARTPLSPSLANALWAVERDRKGAAGKNAAAAEENDNGPNGGVLGRYLEFAVSSTDEFH